MSSSSTALLLTGIALGSLVVGIALQRLVRLAWLSFDADAAETKDSAETTPVTVAAPRRKPTTMTYAEAMSALARLQDAEPLRGKRRRKRARAKPEPVVLSRLRYGEYSTDDARLTIQAWRPDAAHRLAGHVVIDIIPKAESTSAASVRRLAIDLETVEAARVVEVADGVCAVLAVRDYEVKGQGIIFKDLEYTKDVGVDDTTLYVVLVVKTGNDDRVNAFKRLTRGLGASAAASSEVGVMPAPDAAEAGLLGGPSSVSVVGGPLDEPPHAGATGLLAGDDVAGGAVEPPPPPPPPEADPIVARPDLDIDTFFSGYFAHVFSDA